MNYRHTIKYCEYCFSYYCDSKKSTIAQSYLRTINILNGLLESYYIHRKELLAK